MGIRNVPGTMLAFAFSLPVSTTTTGSCFLSERIAQGYVVPLGPRKAFHLDLHQSCAQAVATHASSEAAAARRARRQARVTEERDLASIPGIPSFASLAGPLRRRSLKTLQVNIGLTCSLACRHCHVESSPMRAETMSREVADRLIELTQAHVGSETPIDAVDITGGAPEMHAEFRHLVSSFHAMGLTIIDRCNLDVLSLPGQEDLADFLAQHRVKIVASLPCYTPANVEKQRGDGVFDASIAALQSLNKIGYGLPGSGLELDLVYNPLGPSLPPPQDKLEADYRRELRRAFGISFTRLICITNMPIKRFADDIRRTSTLQPYMELLVSSFNKATVESLMCRDQIHVSYDGTLSDCDFNYALDLPTAISTGERPSIFEVDSFSQLSHGIIRTGPHCYGCTAGSGSSCGGSLA